MPQEFDTRVGAYGVIVEGGRILLAHVREDGCDQWTLPGGGLELGEDPTVAALREITEETGYLAELQGLLGIDTLYVRPEERLTDRSRPLLSLRLIYVARVVGGDLSVEADGSTDDARWFELDGLTAIERVELVDIALRLLHESRQPVAPSLQLGS